MPIEILRPIGPGDLTTTYFISIPNVGTDHWQNVDEVVQDGDATYLRAATINNWFAWDLYQLNNMVHRGVVINSVTLVSWNKIIWGRGSLTAFRCRARLKTHGTQYDYSWAADTINWRENRVVRTTNPFTGLPWTVDELDDVQIGPGLQKYDVILQRQDGCGTQIYLEVDFAVAIPTVTTDPATEVT